MTARGQPKKAALVLTDDDRAVLSSLPDNERAMVEDIMRRHAGLTAAVKANRKLTLPPGPNNPVGVVWIDLTAPSYGIHGTPEPQNISKSESHGCIRLTNWDAVDLATMVHPGTVVKFDDQDTPVLPLAAR